MIRIKLGPARQLLLRYYVIGRELRDLSTLTPLATFSTHADAEKALQAAVSICGQGQATAGPEHGTLPPFPAFHGLVDGRFYAQTVERLDRVAHEQLLAGHATRAQYAAWRLAFEAWQDEIQTTGRLGSKPMTATETLDQAYGPQNYSIRRAGFKWELLIWRPMRLADGTESASRGVWELEGWARADSYEAAAERFAKRIQENPAQLAAMKQGLTP